MGLNIVIIQEYGPDTSYVDVEYEDFCHTVHDAMNFLPSLFKGILMGVNLHMKTGLDIGKFGLGLLHECGLSLLLLCVMNDLCLANTIFKHKMNHRFT